MRVADGMTPDPMTVPPTVSAEGAAVLLRYYQVRHLPVVDDGRLVGMISDRDLVAGVVGNRSCSATVARDEHSVAEMMSAPVLTVTADEELAVATRRMLASRVSALAVVDGTGRLVGLLTSTDCLLALLQVMPASAATAEGMVPASS